MNLCIIKTVLPGMFFFKAFNEQISPLVVEAQIIGVMDRSGLNGKIQIYLFF